MAENTKNLNLKKPAQNEFYNIDDFNENFQKIDDFAKNVVQKDGNGKIDNELLPEMNYIPTSEKGKAGGVAPLTEDGKVDATYLPSMNYAPKDHNHNNSSGGFQGGTDASASEGGAIGKNATATSGGAVGIATKTTVGAAVGFNAQSGAGGAVGQSSLADDGGAVGNGAKTGDGFAGGYNAKTLDAKNYSIDAIQLGTGTNPNPKTLQIYDYQLMNANGVVPGDRLPIYHGSYQGVGGYGINNPNTITFPFKPNAVVISHSSSVTSGTTTTYYITLPLVYGCSMGFVSLSSSTREAPYNIPLHLTWEGNTLSWYYIKTDNNGVSYQLNLPSETYEYVAW